MVDIEDASSPRAGFPRRRASLHNVPSAVIGLMAEYLQPPDVYHLLAVLDKDLTVQVAKSVPRLRRLV